MLPLQGAMTSERKCQRCGCTDDRACARDGGCFWVPGLEDVCSACATPSELYEGRLVVQMFEIIAQDDSVDRPEEHE